MDIKEIKLYDEETGKMGNPLSIVPDVEDIFFKGGIDSLLNKLKKIDLDIKKLSGKGTTHKHMVADIIDFPKGLSSFDNDVNFITLNDIKDITHTHPNIDTLNTITPTLLTSLSDKYTKSVMDGKLQNLLATTKTLFATIIHKHSISELTDYKETIVPTEVSQLNNDSGYMTKTEFNNSGALSVISLAHSHNNILVLTSITQDMLDGFANKYTKKEVDDKISQIVVSGGGGDNAYLLAEIQKRSMIGHVHPISEVNGLENALYDLAPLNHTHVIDNITGLTTELDAKAPLSHMHPISEIKELTKTLIDTKENSYNKEIMNAMLKDLSESKADSYHMHLISNIIDISKIVDITGEWTSSPFNGIFNALNPPNIDSCYTYNYEEDGMYLYINILNCVYKYNADTYTLQNTNITLDKYFKGSSIIINNGMIYMIGGNVSSDSITYNTSSMIYCYNFDGTFVKTIDMNTKIYDATCTVMYGQLFIIGGKNELNTTLSTCLIYDLAQEDTEMFTYVSLENPRSKASVVLLEGVLYLIGGQNDSGNLYSIEYCINNNGLYRWLQHTVTLQSSHLKPLLTTINSFILIIGGNTTVCESIDTNKRISYILDSMKIDKYSNFIGYGRDGYVYMIKNGVYEMYSIDYKPKSLMGKGMKGQIPFINKDNTFNFTNEYILKKLVIVDNTSDLNDAKSNVNVNTIYDITSNKIYKLNTFTSLWEVDSTKTIIDEIGIGHFAFNEYTGKLYYADDKGIIKPLNNNIKNMNVTGTFTVDSKDIMKTIDKKISSSDTQMNTSVDQKINTATGQINTNTDQKISNSASQINTSVDQKINTATGQINTSVDQKISNSASQINTSVDAKINTLKQDINSTVPDTVINSLSFIAAQQTFVNSEDFIGAVKFIVAQMKTSGEI